MKRLPILLSLPALLAVGLLLPSDRRGYEAAVPRSSPDAAFVGASHEANAAAPIGEMDGLLAARVALGCGNCILGKARECTGATAQALLELAAGQYRACLSYQLDGGETAKLLAEARCNLDATQRLLTRAGATSPAAGRQAAKEPAPVPAQLPPPVPVPQAAEPMPMAAAPAGEPVMVGPDGVIYHRVSNNGR
jgi:hypothetical protein